MKLPGGKKEENFPTTNLQTHGKSTHSVGEKSIKEKKNSLAKCNGKSGKMDENGFEITRKLFFFAYVRKKNSMGKKNLEKRMNCLNDN